MNLTSSACNLGSRLKLILPDSAIFLSEALRSFDRSGGYSFLASVAMLVVQINLVLADPLNNDLPVFTPSQNIVAPTDTTNPQLIANVINNNLVIGNISVKDNAMTVTQSTNKMIVDWNSFNIGSSASVHFAQPNPSSSVLNRVGFAGGMSEIYGRLTSTGQVYLINPNGILFGKGSVVDVNSLVASSLGISNEIFNKGILSISNGDPAFSGESSNGAISLEGASGEIKSATLKAANGGKIMLFAPSVTNNGVIETPDGQTLIAAGQKVYLYASGEPNMRGLLVEVDGGGTTTNLNQIIAERGNITLAGITVNQKGLLRATTSLTSNGSIRLQAQDTTNTNDINTFTNFIRRRSTVAGEVVLDQSSLTEVLLDYSDKSTVLDSVNVNRSFVDISAKNIHLLNNARIVVPSGDVNLVAGINPYSPTIFDKYSLANINDSHIFFENDSGIDVSGIGSGSFVPERLGESAAQVSVASNVVQAELRSTELKDSPLQREGILKAAKVYVDSRLRASDGSVGTSVADVSGYTSQVQQGLSARLSTGGNVKVQSEGDIVFAPSAFVDVSGGRIDYVGGLLSRTILLGANGRSYDILNAPKDLTYNDIQHLSYYEQGYTNGKDAGRVSFSAPAMVLEGKLTGGVIVGERQRAVGDMPNGGTLQIGQNKPNFTDSEANALQKTYVLHSDLVLDANHQVSELPVYGLTLAVEKQQTLVLGSNFTSPVGFKSLNYYADGQIIVESDTNISVLPGGSILLNGGGVEVKGNLLAHSGTINLSSKVMDGYVGSRNNIYLNNVELGNSSTLDVSGLWTNDFLAGVSLDRVAIAGGKVNISASSLNNSKGNILLNTGSLINVSGGAWLDANRKISAGSGGAIVLLASAGIGDDLTATHSGQLVMNGSLRSDSLSIGGSLTLSAGSITIGSEAKQTNGETLITPNFFQQGGFSSYSLNGFEGLMLQQGVTIAPKSLTRILNSDYILHKSGEDIQDFSKLSLLPATNASLTRKATNLNLSATNQWTGSLVMESDTQIILDPSASVTLNGKRQLTILGTIKAPSGSISMTSGLLSGESGVVPYFSNQTLWLGEKSILDVSAIVDSYTNSIGMNVASVKDAGSIALKASKGEIVAQEGAQVHLDGIHAIVDVKSGSSYTSKDIASKGGSLTISAREGILWGATMTAQGGSERVAAGEFMASVPLFDINALTSSNQTLTESDRYPINTREIILSADIVALPSTLKPGDSINSSFNGKAYISMEKINNAGFDSIAFTKSTNIRISENLELSTKGAINLDAPNIILDNGVTANIKSSFIGMGNSQVLSQDMLDQHLTTIGNAPRSGVLNIQAEYIDLYGRQNLHGIANVNFNTSGDIQLRGVLQDISSLDNLGNIPTTLIGQLQTAGNLNFTAGRIYPSTFSNFSLKGVGENSSIGFNRAAVANDISVPFSVLGKLNVEAKKIDQDGVLLAPFGEINLKANEQLVVGTNSLTSVSGGGSVLPFGSTLNGKDWSFDEGDRFAIVSTLPDKKVNLEGQSVKILSGSKVDISGGGDLAAWEFTVGTGGSKDVLAAPGVFAILPQFKAGYMSGNSGAYSNTTLKAGDSIYLSGGNGLAAGNYVLLPAHYALLPGAYSLKAVSGTQDMNAQQNIVNADGSMLVSGYRMQYGGLVADDRTSGFLVAAGSIARTQSEFTTTLASSYFKTKYSDANLTSNRLTGDAGRLVIGAQDVEFYKLKVDPSPLEIEQNVENIKKNFKTAAEGDGRGAEVDISSNKIAISGNATSGGDGYLTLSSAILNAMGAESLLVGGRRSSVASGTMLDVTASNVELIGNANLSGQEIMLASKDILATAIGTTISVTGKAISNSGALIIGTSEEGSGDGAFLRVSTGAQRELRRVGVIRSQGTLDVAGNITNAKSVILDATYSDTLNGRVGMVSGGSLSVGAPKISFGTTINPVGLLFDTARLSALGSPSNLLLSSYSTLDFYGSVSLGDINLEHLSIRGAGINGYASTGKTTITAKTVDLSNAGGVSFISENQLGEGILEVNAKEIISGSNTFKTAGFSEVTLNADQFMGQGVGELEVVGNLNISANRITAAGLSDQTIKASGSLQTRYPTDLKFTGDGPSPLNAPLGGKLTLTANSINHAANIEMPSGVVTLTATGTGDSLTLKDGSTISAKGSAQMLGTVAVLVDGGKVNIQTLNGNITMESAAGIDVSATGGASAGSLLVRSTGNANLLGTLKGDADAVNGLVNPKQGSFEYYATTLNGFQSLNALLEKNTISKTGGFNESRNIHVTQGDLIVTNTITAHNLSLTTDDGNVYVIGGSQINASGAKGGIVNLNAGQKSGSGKGNIILESGAIIDASATKEATEVAGSTGDGGKVTLSVVNDINTSPTIGSMVTLGTGSIIDLSGKGLGSDGTLILRAPRTGVTGSEDSGTGINAIASISSSNVRGNNANILVEGVKTYSNTGDLSINTSYASTLYANNTSFLTNANSIKLGLGALTDARVLVIAGDEVRSTGTITISDDMNLQTWSPGALTIRAARDIAVNGSISAGFTSTSINATLTDGGSWTYRMIAGADLHSSDAITTNDSLLGNFTLAAGKIIRTGTGEIQIATGGSFSLGSSASVIYTAGEVDLKDYSDFGSFKQTHSLSSSAKYSINGGDIQLVSKGDILGQYTNQLPASWQFRLGRLGTNGDYTQNTTWWTSFQYFNENIGALGGGDVNISARGKIDNLSAIVTTNGRMFGAKPASSTLVVNGGGDLTIDAGTDILGGLYMVDKGTLKIRAGGGLMENASKINTAFALGDGQIDVQTVGQLNLITVFNPTLTGLSAILLPKPIDIVNYSSAFSTYSSDSSVNITSISSGVNIKNDFSLFTKASLKAPVNLNLFPSKLKAVALGGDLTISEQNMALIPSSEGDLQLISSGSVDLKAVINMSDNDINIMPSQKTPYKVSEFNTALTKIMNTFRYDTAMYHASSPVHEEDQKPVLIYAGQDILGTGNFSLFLPKKAEIYAGRDIKNLAIFGQNLKSSDITSIVVGRDIVNPIGDTEGVLWGGPGYLNISVGRNIDLNTSVGIVTRGNLDNPYLPENGANLSLLVGASSTNDSAFISKYLTASPTNPYNSALVSFVKKTIGFNSEYTLSTDDAWQAFDDMQAPLKNQFVQSVFFNELAQAAIEHNDPTSQGFGNYKRGFDAIKTYFPNDAYSGSLNLSFSQLKTERGGDLNVMSPGGGVIVGLPKTPDRLILSKGGGYDFAKALAVSAGKLGIFTIKGGNINIFANNNIDVAQSREFTVAGGDIVNWSSVGDIDAGKGSKTATSAPPPLVRTDTQGNTVVDLSGVVSGSGIGTLQTLKDAPLGNVYLIAPSGTVDAGDAGVRSSGNLLVAAQTVANGANMQAGGTSSGVPAPSTSNVSFSAPVSADSSNSAKQADKSTEAASKSANKTASALPSLITVEILSLGDESSSVSDPEKDEKKKAKKQQN